jgi:preprotein translocase subunit YajC
MIDAMVVFAQLATAPAAPGGGGGGGTGQQADPTHWLIAIAVALGFFYLFMWRSNKKERQKHDDMLSSLKRNDRVQTIGGLLGTIVEVRDQEVVVKIDETNNVKARFNRTAIKDVIREGNAAPAVEESKPAK